MPDPKDVVIDVLGDADVQTVIADRVTDLWRLGRNPRTYGKADDLWDDLANNADLKAAARQVGVVVAQGYLSPAEGHVNTDGLNINDRYLRLYASLDLTDYIDIEKAKVVLKVDLRSPFDPFAGQAIWIEVDAEILRGSTGVQKQFLQGGFLGGSISSGGSGGRAYPGTASPGVWCSGGLGYGSPGVWCSGGHAYGSPGVWCSGTRAYGSPGVWCAG